MINKARQSGLFLPMAVTLMLFFSSFWLVKQQQLSAADHDLMAAVQLQQELLFWHRGVLHFYQILGYWPTNLSKVTEFFKVIQGSSHISGSPSADGYQLQLVGIEKQLLERVISPLKEYFTVDSNGNVYLALKVPDGSRANSHLIVRQSATEIALSSSLDFAGYSLASANIEAAEGHIEEIHSHQLQVLEVLSSAQIAATEVNTNDLLIGGYSLLAQQQKLDAIYQLLWFCLRVSKTCSTTPQLL